MRAPGVEQLNALADLFAEALSFCRPESLAILGIAGGNGLDRVDGAVTRRIVGVDIHPEYLEAVRERHPELPLTLLCADLQRELPVQEPVQMVHAALVFEHAGMDGCLRNAVDLVAGQRYLTVVLQLPSRSQAGVAPTGFASIQNLKENFRLIEPSEFCSVVSAMGLALVRERECALAGGKSFWMGIFRQGR
ncbi:MAG: class I SAM-dependent methyltransferase [Bryobacterales bacterium]|nr:class I SAM-dependent methyltransferase [Bryobacterales bacterium]